MKNLYPFWILFLIAGFSSQAQNQYFNQQILPLGDESSLLANSGIAGQSPHSAAIFNPAALVLNQGQSFSFSGNAYYEFQFRTNALNTGANQDLELSASGLQVLPSSLIYHLEKWGHHLSFALTSPSYLDYDGLDRYTVGSGATSSQLTIEQGLSESMYSGFLGLARELGGGWSMGFSLYGNYYSMLSAVARESYLLSDPSEFERSDVRKEAESYSLGFMLGALKQWEKFKWGLVLSSMNFNIYSNGSEYLTFSQGGTNPLHLEQFEDEINTFLANGLRLGSGIDYSPSANLSLSLDYNYFFEQESALFEDELLAQASWRLSGGLKYRFHPNFRAFFGYAYLPESKNGSQWPTRILTTGGRLKIKNSLNTLGFFWAASEDETLNTRSSLDYFGILIGSSVSLDWDL